MIAPRTVALALAIAVTACAAPVATAPSTGSAPAATAASPQSTPIPTTATPWTELRWSAPVPIPDRDAILQVVGWKDGYLAAGQTTGGGAYVGGLFASPDGVHWQRSAIVPVGPTVVTTDARAIAVVTTGRESTPRVQAWVSTDGRSWAPEDALTIAGASIDHLAARGSAIVGIGTDSAGHTAVWRSIDGAAWTRGDPPSAHAIVRAVSAVRDGFVALGREGDPDVASGGVGAPGVGLPAAWWSADGRSWTALEVEGKPAAGAQLLQLFPVSEGYVAVGSDATDPSANARSALIWLSTDARTWRLLGPRPYTGPAGANGAQAVSFAPSSGGARGLEARLTHNGRQWVPLTFTGDLADIPNLPGFAAGGAQLDQVFVMTHGIVVIGQQSGRAVAWYADAEPR
ncbi:MAG TPA: hypothetical protein VGT60_00500 [Candidatus Limnocylindria bacterium]|nr:hypothetical protein [Candidatus Limnocylindria bacterium]